MEINGIKYVKEETIEKIREKERELERENKKLKELIKIIAPIGEEEIQKICSFGRYNINYALKLYGRDIGENARFQYEQEIYKLKCELKAANSQIAKIKNQYRNEENEKIKITTCEKKKLLSVKKLLDEIFE